MDQRQRRRVEIYFILYLLALVLLMPDRPVELAEDGTATTPVRIDLFPERVRLSCEVKRDSLGNALLVRMDSTNVIRYSPELTGVSVRALIEDVASGQVLVVQEDSKSGRRFASLRHDRSRNAFVFTWSPLIDATVSKTFRVTIQANGVPMNGVATDALRAVGSTQFVLTTIVNDQQPPQLVFLPGRRDTLVLREELPPAGQSSGPGEFWLEPARTSISMFALQEWTNRIVIGGADPQRDLMGLPTIRLSGEAMSDVARLIDQRTIVITGRAPRSGVATVEVSARRADGTVASTSFTVSGLNYSRPVVPDIVYPGVDYLIDPKMPTNAVGVRAVLRDGGRELAAVVDGQLRFRMSTRDTGKTIVFERTIDGVAETSPHLLAVRPFPAPVIREIRRDQDPNKRSVVVQFFSHDRTENRPTLRVIDGNVGAVRKLSGYLRPADNAKPTVSWIEVFEVTRREESKPFVFRVQATDERGRESSITSAD
ncbi:MAG: hypothetical protein RL594_879 [Bacteroidota bacterium]|jgi:hypothetical protein